MAIYERPAGVKRVSMNHTNKADKLTVVAVTVGGKEAFPGEIDKAYALSSQALDGAVKARNKLRNDLAKNVDDLTTAEFERSVSSKLQGLAIDVTGAAVDDDDRHTAGGRTVARMTLVAGLRNPQPSSPKEDGGDSDCDDDFADIDADYAADVGSRTLSAAIAELDPPGGAAGGRSGKLPKAGKGGGRVKGKLPQVVVAAAQQAGQDCAPRCDAPPAGWVQRGAWGHGDILTVNYHLSESVVVCRRRRLLRLRVVVRIIAYFLDHCIFLVSGSSSKSAAFARQLEQCVLTCDDDDDDDVKSTT